MNPPPHDVAAGTGLRIIIMHFHFLIWRIANNPPVTSSSPSSFLRRTKIHAGAFDRFRELHARIFAVPSIQESPVQQQPATTFFSGVVVLLMRQSEISWDLRRALNHLFLLLLRNYISSSQANWYCRRSTCQQQRRWQTSTPASCWGPP